MRRGGSHEGDEAGSVDDAPAGVEAFGWVFGILAHGEDGVLAAPPHALEVNIHSQIPDALLGVQRVVVRRVHDSRIVELPDQEKQIKTLD